MLTLLLLVIVCGIVAWVLHSFGLPQPYLNIALAILLIIVVVYFFKIVLGVSLPSGGNLQ